MKELQDKDDFDGFILSTGKKIYANRGILGISQKSAEEGWSITEGYDGGIATEELTKQEAIEMATYAIILWTNFIDDVLAGRVDTEVNLPKSDGVR